MTVASLGRSGLLVVLPMPFHQVGAKTAWRGLYQPRTGRMYICCGYVQEKPRLTRPEDSYGSHLGPMAPSLLAALVFLSFAFRISLTNFRLSNTPHLLRC